MYKKSPWSLKTEVEEGEWSRVEVPTQYVYQTNWSTLDVFVGRVKSLSGSLFFKLLFTVLLHCKFYLEVPKCCESPYKRFSLRFVLI